MRLIITIIGLLLLAACGPEVTRPAPPTSPDANLTKLIEAREYQQAADESLKLSKLYPDKSVHYQQQAIEIYLQSGDLYAAKAILEDLRPDNDRDRLLTRLLEAKLALQGKDPAQALKLLPSSPPTGAQDPMLREYFETRSMAHEQQRNFLEAARQRLQLAPLLTNPQEAAENTARIWAIFNKLNVTALRQYRSTTPDLASWLELAIINQTLLFQPDALRPAVSMWQTHYPDHPANVTISRQMLAASGHDSFRPKHIALCLPFSGPLATVSQAIRDGFLSAWYGARDYQPVIDIYDAATVNITSVYATAVANGADLVVGPLEKSAITRLLTSGDLPVTTLALNQTDTPLSEKTVLDQTSAVPKILLFGLSPEDEAREVANRARQDGYQRALIITPDNDRGQRLAEAFRSQWLSSGGSIMEQVRYPETAEEYKTWVKSLLNANSSDQRLADLRTRLNRNLRSETRLRSDADVIFMAANPITARRIVPEFRFYQTRIPIYATSDIYSGMRNSQQDKDLENVTFNHMPWILDPAMQQSILQQTISRHWPSETSVYRNFYALGIDSYRIITQLARMALLNSITIPGATGELSLADDGHIQRKLLWAKFTQGEPMLLDQQF